PKFSSLISDEGLVNALTPNACPKFSSLISDEGLVNALTPNPSPKGGEGSKLYGHETETDPSTTAKMAIDSAGIPSLLTPLANSSWERGVTLPVGILSLPPEEMEGMGTSDDGGCG
ncbi:MAG: hypothetical protein Q6K70_01145, partial [Thermostichales cyanobacterium DRC_bins_46]